MAIVSIVVPTKNRYFYLKKLIKVIDAFENKNLLEVVIQDNTENNSEILDFLHDNIFPFVKYYHVKEPLPISKNSDLAIRNSSCEYVSFIGDDDGVTQYVIDCVKWMMENNIECVVPDGFRYRWNDSENSVGIMKTGSFSYKKISYRMHKIKVADVLEECMKDGFISRGNLPMLYHGIVKRSVIDKIWDTCGSYFPGASPDIANGVALCFVLNEYYKADFPFVYSGASKHLGGGAVRLKHRATDNFKDLPFLPADIENKWCPKIPKVWSGCTIWCESSVEAINSMHKDELLDQINFENLYTEFVAFHYYYRAYALKLTSNKLKLLVKSYFRRIKHYYQSIKKIIKIKIFGNSVVDGFTTIYGLNDIIDANQFIESKSKNLERSIIVE